MSIPQFGLFETTLRMSKAPDDPFHQDVFATCSFSGASADASRSVRVPLFYDGDGTYRLRFFPEIPGSWRYALAPTYGLTLDGDTEGEFECVPSVARGPLRRAEEPHHFQYANGERAFILGNTAYNLVASYQRSPEEARQFVAYYAARGFNWFRFFLQQVTWDSHGFVVWPWGGTPEAPDYATFNLALFHAAEDVIRLLGEHDATASVILLHPSDPVFRGQPNLLPIFQRFVRYATARLSAFSNVVWNIANEWQRELVLSAAEVEALGRTLEEADPYRRLTSVHHHGRFEFPRSPWVDMASMQHRGLPAEINRVALLNRQFGKPVLNEEYGYERDNLGPPNDPVNVRRDTWALTMAGAYASYGDKTKGSKVGVYFSSTLKDSVGAVVPDMLRHLPALMARVPYWEMHPANEALSGCIREECFCLAKLGEQYLVYMTVGQNVSLDLTHVDGGTLKCEWWNPRTGEVSAQFTRLRFE